jgi:hypothetical protein
MATRELVSRRVREAKRILRHHGYDVRTTARDLRAWFRAYTPYESSDLDEALKEPLIVVHQLVEIELVKMMGLRLSKNVIVDNLDAVDRAHLEATRTEMDIAVRTGAAKHVRSRMKDMARWIKDPTVSKEQKLEYRDLLARTKKAIEAKDARGKS